MSALSCTRCNRPLRNPASVQNGMGPVCAARAHAKLERGARHGPPIGSDWRVVKSDAEQRIVWIVDEDRGRCSVTNDADNVVLALQDEYPGYRVIYRDSMGLWDELQHEAGRFIGFAPARDLAPAVEPPRCPICGSSQCKAPNCGERV